MTREELVRLARNLVVCEIREIRGWCDVQIRIDHYCLLPEEGQLLSRADMAIVERELSKIAKRVAR